MANENADTQIKNTNSKPNIAVAPASVVTALTRQNSSWAGEVIEGRGEVTVVVPRDHIAGICAFLKTAPDLEFNFLADLSGVDRGVEEDPRFEVNYHLFSTKYFHRLRLKVVVSEDDAQVPSVTSIWRTANWHERETYDLFGVVFQGHPDLRRILLPDEWEGHALRKDFPLRGYEPYSLT